MVLRCTVLTLFLFLCAFVTSSAHAWEARVVAVTDGDTITVEPLHGGQRTKIKLYGVDSPELSQHYGQTAKAFTTENALFKSARIESKNVDAHGRTVALVDIEGEGSLQKMLLESGFAWVYPDYCKNCEDWLDIQGKAQSRHFGLWFEPNPIPPWEWRKMGNP